MVGGQSSDRAHLAKKMEQGCFHAGNETASSASVPRSAKSLNSIHSGPSSSAVADEVRKAAAMAPGTLRRCNTTCLSAADAAAAAAAGAAADAPAPPRSAMAAVKSLEEAVRGVAAVAGAPEAEAGIEDTTSDTTAQR